MATATSAFVWDSSTDALFRAWGSAVAALMVTGGFWAYSTDTGQINWSTVTTPAAGVFAGYEIYKSQDALSSTNPIYIKVEYGCNSSATKGPQLRFSFGTGTNGAGLLTGNVSGTYLHNTAVSGNSPTTYTSFASGGTGYFGMMLYNTATDTKNLFLIIERSMDSTGAYTNAYVTWVLQTASTFSQRTMLKPSTGAFMPENTSGPFTLFWSGASAAAGTFASPFPVFPFLGYPDNPMTAICGMKSGDITEGANFSVSFYGTAHNYLWSNRTNLNFGSGGASTGLGMRYE